MTLSRSGLSFVLLACLSACHLPGPATDARLDLPPEWKNAGAFPVAAPSKDLQCWWGKFGDPTLTSLIAQGLRNSPDVAIAAARVREARARRDAQSAALFPVLSGSAATTSRATRTDTGGQTDSTSYSAGLDASWEIDLFEKNRSALAGAAAEVGAAGENAHSVRAALAAEIAASYTTLRASQARLTVLKRNLETREQTARLASWRLKAGAADALESTQALTSLESARAGLPALEQTIAQTRNALALLVGGNPGSLDAKLAASTPIPHPSESLAIGIPADLLRQRPDVRGAGYRVLAAAASRRVADAARFPSLRLSGTLGLNALRAGKIFNPESTAATIVGGLSAPIFDAGRLRANFAAADAVLDQNIETYRRTVLTALSETENALIACRRSAERLATLESAARLARQADVLARQRYTAGEIDFASVLETQRTLLGLEDSLIATRADRTTAYIRLYQALGGGR